jgi:hypothetical protein
LSSNVSLDQILGELEKSESVSDNQIISTLLSKDNISVKTEIPIPPSAQNAATLKMLSKVIEHGFSKKASELTITHFNDSLEFAVSHERGSRKEIEHIFTKSPRQNPEVKAQKTDLLGQLYGR